MRFITTIFIIGFLLNIIWENAQAPLYQGYTGFWDHFMTCFWASLVDAVVILMLGGLVAMWHNDLNWIKDFSWKEAAVLAVIGGAIAVIFELWAFKVKMWEYKESMLVVPFLNIGLTPLLQMMMLPVVTYYIAGKLLKKVPNR